MKIALLLESFQPDYWGGRETRWYRLISYLNKDHQLTIFGDFSRVLPVDAFENHESMNFVDIGPLPSMYREKGNRSLWHAFLFSTRTVSSLRGHFDFVLTDQTPLFSIPLLRIKSFFLSSKLVVVWHEVWDLKTWFRYSKCLGVIGYSLQYLAILTSTYIIVPSIRVRDSLLKKHVFSRVQVIPNGVDDIPYLETQDENRVRSPNYLNLLYVGRVIRHKNCHLLIEVIEKSRHLNQIWKLTIVGTGPELMSIKRQAYERGVSSFISFRSNISPSELNQIYLQSDVFVFPSEREGFGIAVAEALSKNIPVVVFDTKSNASIDLVLSPKWGIMVSDLSVEKWVAAIENASQLDSKYTSAEFFSSQKTWTEVYELFISYLNEIT